MDFLTLNAGSSTALAGGNIRIFGTTDGSETVTLVTPLAGQSLTVVFDGSFNAGGDTIVFAGNPGDYTIVRSGSSVVIEGNGISATIPVGAAGTSIQFGNNDPLELAGGATGITLGTQTVTTAETAVGGGGTTPPPPPPPPPVGGPILFTVGQDFLEGTDGDDTFLARVVQNTAGTGAVTNTFDSGDVFDGGPGLDIARISLTSVVTGGQFGGPAISSESTSVEQFFIRTQFDNFDTPGFSGSLLTESLQAGSIVTQTDFDAVLFGSANIDAQLNDGVQQWWSENSRADLIIEDIRERSDTVTFGFRDSDPGVSYAAFFDPGALRSDLSDSTLTLTLIDQVRPADLLNFPVSGVTFTLDGQAFTVTVPRVNAGGQSINNSYSAFVTALQASIDAIPGLENVTATLNANNTITIEDNDGGIFTTGNYLFVNDQVPGTGNLIFNQEVGAPIVGPISTSIVLDGVGRGQEGGLMAVGSMGGTDGVEVFNVLVDDTSHLQALLSTNNILETVNVSHLTATSNGALRIGSATQNPNDDFVTGNQGLAISTTTDDRLSTTGLSDVQTFDAEGFRETLFVGAQITSQSFDKYLDGATEEVPFLYHLGDGGSNLTISIDTVVLGDVDFGIDIIGGAENDRVNLVLGSTRKDNIDIDLEGGDNNIVELNTSTTGGTAAFEGFENVQTLVVAGSNNTIQDIVAGNMLGLETILISTRLDGMGTGVSTEIERAEEDTSITVTGKQQTVGAQNNDNNQLFNVITIEDNSNENLLLTLDNTARVDGRLTVNSLVITGPASDVETLTLLSGGERETSNEVISFVGAGVDTLDLIGTQDLGIIVTTIASGATVDMLIDGSELEGNLTLGINGSQLNGGSDDEIIGTDGANDRLALFGTLDTNTEIDGFENIQFGIVTPSTFTAAVNSAAQTVQGTFSFANVSGDNNNILVTNLSNSLRLTNLSGDTIINVGDTSSTNVGQLLGAANEALTFEGTDDDDAITVNLNSVIGQASDLINAGFTSVLDDPLPTNDFIDISGFEDVTVNVSRQAQLGGGASDYEIDLRLDDAFGVDLDAAAAGTLSDEVADFVTDGAADNDAAVVDEILESLTITGGGTTTLDLLDVGANILGSISTIDVSGYHGTFLGNVINTIDREAGTVMNPVQSANVDRTFIIGDDDVFIGLQALTANDSGLGVSDGDATSIDTNTIFRFTDGVTTSGDADGIATWTISNFVAGEFIGANVGNYSVLNFAGLGLTNFTQLTVQTGTFNLVTETFTVDNVAGTDTRISDGSGDWQVILLDVQAEDLLESENFNFSASSDVGSDIAIAPAIEPAMDMMMIDSFAFA